jgi:Domain of unknown function (DUF6532)
LHRIHELDLLYGLESLDDNHGRVVMTARALYRCRLSCKDAFPSPDLKEEWAKDVWKEACAKESYPDLLRKDKEVGFICLPPHGAQIHVGFQFVYSNMGLLTQFKAEIKHAVESLYGFDTSRAPDIISRNAYRAQQLLTNMTFIYQVRHISSPFVAN